MVPHGGCPLILGLNRFADKISSHHVLLKGKDSPQFKSLYKNLSAGRPGLVSNPRFIHPLPFFT
jgi:hypothetical protein